MARVQILSKEEQIIFPSTPKFNFSQKEYYFKLPEALQEFSTTLRGSSNRVYFSLLYGYYRANNIFYDSQKFRHDDILFIKEKLNLGTNIDSFMLSQRHIRRYKQIRLNEKYGGLNNHFFL